jgi:cytochrome c
MMRVRLLFGAVLMAGALWSAGSTSAQAPAAGDPEAGKAAFDATCRVCHTGSIGPKLEGVVGRPIAGAPDFARYTPALKARSGETWDEAKLDALLTAPAAFAPGTTMLMAAPDPVTRANIIAYLKSLRAAAQ